MGYSLCWAAVRNGNAKRIHSLLGLLPTDIWQEVPESRISGAALPAGWYSVLFNRKALNDAMLERLSTPGEVVSCFAEENVMFSCASGWKHGKSLWSVIHDCKKGHRHLEINGDAPAIPKGIQAKLVHIYDFPAELAKDLTGFRHDQDKPGMRDQPFQVLEKKSFWSGLLAAKT